MRKFAAQLWNPATTENRHLKYGEFKNYKAIFPSNVANAERESANVESTQQIISVFVTGNSKIVNFHLPSRVPKFGSFSLYGVEAYFPICFQELDWLIFLSVLFLEYFVYQKDPSWVGRELFLTLRRKKLLNILQG